MVVIGGLGIGALLLTLCLASTGSGVRARDVYLVLAGIGVLLMPLAHFALAFVGFVLNPRHFVGDYWTMQRDARLEAIIAALVISVLVIGAGSIGGTSRPRRGWRLGVGVAEVIAGLVFAGVELSVDLPALADAANRIGTIPM